jgi:hypothetical protein
MCARYRVERYQSNRVLLGARRAKQAYDELEALIATPIKKRKSRTIRPKAKSAADSTALKNLRRGRVDEDLVLEAEAIDALADED